MLKIKGPSGFLGHRKSAVQDVVRLLAVVSDA